jgi:hypothetical protein
MGTQQIDVNAVPGLSVIQARLAAINPGVLPSDAGYDSDRMSYVLVL